MLNYLLTSSLSLALFYGFYILLLQKEKAFQFNRFYLLGSLLMALTFPLFKLPYFPNLVRGEKDSEFVFYLSQMQVPLSNQSSFSPNWINISLVTYLAGVLFFAYKTLVQYGKLLLFISKQKKKKKGKYILINTNGQYPTCAFFHFLLWNNKCGISIGESKEILNHELTHINEKHSLDILFVEILKIVFWFNPLFRFYQKAVSENHEYIADHSVIEHSSTEEYISLLAKQVIQQIEFSPANHFNKSRTLKRITMLKTNKTENYWKLLASIPLTVLIFTMASCEKEELTATTPHSNESMVASEQPTLSTKQLEDSNEIFTVVENKPEVNGGTTALYKGLAKNLVYPDEARKLGVEGRVYLQFIVNEDGSISDTKAVRGIGAGCDEAAVEAFQKTSNELGWLPGEQAGKKVKVKVVLPIIFKLSK
ncbi:M56 family metallopeptidase [Xanthovirga aplysinae]|uniref:M56 family metallopeptidase n=1 Tax=Xanthovirga aplysinae TaxID=2529853 RepID=UPI0012BD66A0|nr:M56 family metallopeptidase [Xanthovirga aplysinae]MTI30499.1 TonB family protein [Xanthovirga aplysinae]